MRTVLFFQACFTWFVNQNVVMSQRVVMLNVVATPLQNIWKVKSEEGCKQRAKHSSISGTNPRGRWFSHETFSSVTPSLLSLKVEPRRRELSCSGPSTWRWNASGPAAPPSQGTWPGCGGEKGRRSAVSLRSWRMASTAWDECKYFVCWVWPFTCKHARKQPIRGSWDTHWELTLIKLFLSRLEN